MASFSKRPSSIKHTIFFHNLKPPGLRHLFSLNMALFKFNDLFDWSLEEDDLTQSSASKQEVACVWQVKVVWRSSLWQCVQRHVVKQPLQRPLSSVWPRSDFIKVNAEYIQKLKVMSAYFYCISHRSWFWFSAKNYINGEGEGSNITKTWITLIAVITMHLIILNSDLCKFSMTSIANNIKNMYSL